MGFHYYDLINFFGNICVNYVQVGLHLKMGEICYFLTLTTLISFVVYRGVPRFIGFQFLNILKLKHNLLSIFDLFFIKMHIYDFVFL